MPSRTRHAPRTRHHMPECAPTYAPRMRHADASCAFDGPPRATSARGYAMRGDSLSTNRKM